MQVREFAAGAPDGRVLIREVQHVGSTSAELFGLAGDDAVIGPFELVKVLEPAVRSKMKKVKNARAYDLIFSYKPEITINDQGLIRASVFMKAPCSGNEPIYDLTAQVTRSADSLDAKVLSVSEYFGPRITVTVH